MLDGGTNELSSYVMSSTRFALLDMTFSAEIQAFALVVVVGNFYISYLYIYYIYISYSIFYFNEVFGPFFGQLLTGEL